MMKETSQYMCATTTDWSNKNPHLIFLNDMILNTSLAKQADTKESYLERLPKHKCKGIIINKHAKNIPHINREKHFLYKF